MDTKGFLSAVWPSVGPYLIAIPQRYFSKKTNKYEDGFKHFVHHSVDSAVAHAHALANDRDAPQDVYHALGSVIDDTRPSWDGLRVQSNIAQLRAFWLDIDIKNEPGCYQDMASAASNLKAFVKQLGLPKPMVVGSGGGLHVYWPLDSDIAADQWKHYAGLLKGLTKTWKLHADPSRTADQASVLRPVGTWNWKTGQPREVKVLMPLAGPIGKTAMLSAIASAAERLNVKPQVSSSPAASLGLTGTNPAAGQATLASNADAANGAVGEEIPSNPKKVVAKCRQLRWQAENPQQVDEPQWYAMIGCLRHAEKGEKAVHMMSRQYGGYSQAETDSKIAHHRDGGFGPTTCVSFDNARPGGCDDCPYKGKVTTPLQLGRERPEAAAPTVAFSSAGGQQITLQLPDPPAPFKRVTNAATGSTCITVTIVNEDDDEQEVVIYEHDVYPSGITYDERTRKYYVTIRRFLPRDGWADFEVALGEFYDKRNLSKLLGNIGVMPNMDKIESLVHYMIAYIQTLQKAAKAAMVYAAMGWREDGNDMLFVLPDQVITKAGSEPVSPSRNTVNALSWKEPRGDINTWKQIAALYEAPGMEALQFGFGVGFAAPLFQWTNQTGMIVSLVGEKGCGKSSAMLLANSIWGHKKCGWADIKNDTVNAFYNKLGVLRNLPVSYDEITNLDPEILSDLCYAVSKGQGRQRLDRDGGAKENHGEWQTMMLTTSNTSLHTKLALAKADASAEASRVFEYPVPANTLPKATADAAFDQLNDNFGLAGPIYAAELVKDVARVRNRIQHWMTTIEAQAGVGSNERFWSAGPACVLAGFEIANACGLTNADLGRLLQFSIDTIKKMRTVVQDTTRTGLGIVSDYLNSNLAKTLAINIAPQQGRAVVSQEPRNELRIRYERWHGRLFLDRADFRRYCAERAVDPNKLKQELLGHGILKSEKRVSLGKDTSFGAGQTHTWELDMNHPLMGGTQATVNSSTGVANQAIANAQNQP